MEKKRKKLGRKLLSWLLTLAMIVGLMPGMGLTAYAAPPTGGDEGISIGGVEIGGTAHTHNDITFTAWDSTTSLPTEAGSYYLTQDVTLSKRWKVPSDTTNLCLNGHSITYTGDDSSWGENSSMINIPYDGTLNLYDDGTAEHKYTLDAESDGKQGVARVNDAATGDTVKTFTGGYITGGKYKAIVYNGGVFTMNGGTIIGGFTYGVDVAGGTFNMKGGNILGNYYSGVFVESGTFTMTGGTISYNTSQSEGAGVCVGYGTFDMSGGTISHNTAGTSDHPGFGGGVFVRKSHTFNLSGNPTIADNSDGASGVSNVCLEDDDSTVTTIHITGGLTNTTSIGVMKVKNQYIQTQNGGYFTYVPTPGVFTSGWNTNMSGKTPTDYFASESTYPIVTEGDELKLETPHSHSFSYAVGTGADANTITATCSVDGCPLPSKQAMLAIAADGGTYNSTTTYGATVTNNIPTADGVTVGEIEYYKVDTQGAVTGGTKLDATPTNAGYYYASVTLTGVKTSEGEGKSVTASVSYTIAKATPAVGNFTYSAPSDLTYSGTDKTATVVAKEGITSIGDVTVKYYSDASCTTKVDNPTATGTYYVGITVEEGTNYSASSAVLHDESWKFTIGSAVPSVEDFIYSAPSDLNYDGTAKNATVTSMQSGMGPMTVKYYSNETCTDVVDHPTNVGTYYVGIEVADGDNYSATSTVLHDASWKFTIGSAVPSVEDFIYSAPSDRTYDGNAKTATVMKKDEIIGMGEVSVKYYSDAACTVDVQNPKTFGTYYVGITVSKGQNYTATTSVLHDSNWQFTIDKATPTADDFNFMEPSSLGYDGTAKTATFIFNTQYGVLEGIGNVTVKYYSDAGCSTDNEVDSPTNAGTYYVGIEVAEGGNYSATSGVLHSDSWKFTISKANQTAPVVPMIDSATVNSITLTAIENGEYKCGDGTWQTSPTFSGLTMNTPYTFYQRYAADENHNVSDSSEGATISTSNHAHEWRYKADGATITATCADSDGGHGETKTVTLTIKAPTLTVYGGEGSSEATIEGSIEGVTNPSVVYKKGSETLNPAPTAAGTYTASITLGEGDKTATASVEYTIAKKPVAVSGITASDKTYDGNTTAILVTTAAVLEGKLASDTLTVSATGTFENANVGENKPVTIKDLTLGGTSKDNYILAAEGQQTSTTAKITAKEVDLTWSNTNLIYNGKIQTPVATATGLCGTDTCNVTVDGGQKDANAGTENYTATASALSNANYKLPETKTTTFTIAPKEVTITWSDTTLTYNGKAQKPTAKITAGTVEGETAVVTVEGAKTESNAKAEQTSYTATAVIKFKNYIPSEATKAVEFTIQPKALSDDMLTLTPDSFVQGTDTKTPTITVTDTAISDTALVADDDYTLADGAETSRTDYGTYTITVNGKGNYTGSAAKTWRIEDQTAPTAKITVSTYSFNEFLHTITFGIFFKETQAVTITAEDNAGGSGIDKVYYHVSDTALTEDAVKALADGSWKEGTSFNLDPDQKYVIYAKAVDKSGNKAYVSSDGMVIDAADPVITGVDAGAEYHSAASWKATDDHLDKAEITFVAEGKTAEQGETATKTATDGQPLEGTVSELGSYTVKATDKSGNERTVAFSITRRDADIKGKADSITYEADKTYDLTKLFTVEDGVSVEIYEIVANADTDAAAGAGTITGSTLTVTKAGLITIRATVAEGKTSAAAPEYIKKTTANGTLTVGRADGTASITINNVVYGNEFTVLLSSTNVGVTSETKYTMTADAAGNEIPAASRTESTEKPVNVGTYKAVVSYPASGLYNAVSAQTTFKITPAALTVTAEAKEKTYGGEDPELTYTVSGLKYEDTKESVLTGALTRAEGESVGTYAIGQGTLAANGNYTISYTGADLTIGKKTLTVAAEAKSKTYGAEDPALTYTVSGLENGDTKETVLTGTLTRAAGEAVGTYAIGQGTLTANGNYTVNYTGADLTIGKKTLTVTADAKSKTYGGEDPILTYTVSGLENGDTKETVLTGALTRAEGEAVGTYAIGQGTLAANGNYTINYNGADLTIGKKILTVTAEAKSKKYGEDDPALTYTATGFENGDTKDTVLTGALTRKSGEAVGTYAIQQGTLAANDNYTISYTGADLTIIKTDSKVTAPIANTLTYTGKAQALITAGSTTDGTIVYSLDGKTYAETIPTGANAGEYTVYYKVIGDGNHKDSEAVTVSVTIAKAEMADKTVTDAIEVISAGVKDETVDLTEYLEDGAKLEKVETTGELAKYITPGALTGGIFTYSVAENDGGIAGSIVLTVSSTNYKDYNITINLVSAKKITEVVVESEDVKETAVEAVEVPALEDFTEAQPEATVEVKMEVKLESEETVEKELGTAVLEDIKETVAKAFDGVASTELSQEYLDITVTKSVNGGTAEEIADVNRVLEIAVGYDLTGKFNPVVIREHGGAVSQFTKLNSRPAAGSYKDGTFFVEGSGTSGKIYIYARYFSTYTVAYTTTASYQVTFDDATGDAKHDSNVTQVVVATGAKVAKPADPKRDGYDFEGWYISGTDTKWNFDTAVTSDITLVAHWDEEDDDDDEIVPAPVVPVVQPRSPKTSDALPSYAFWLILAVAGLAVSTVSAKGRRKEQD